MLHFQIEESHYFFHSFYFALMMNANYIICSHIYKAWIEPYKSQRSFALDHNIEESIVRKIKNTALKDIAINYNIPVNTLQKICDARNIKLSDFFKIIGL